MSVAMMRSTGSAEVDPQETGSGSSFDDQYFGVLHEAHGRLGSIQDTMSARAQSPLPGSGWSAHRADDIGVFGTVEEAQAVRVTARASVLELAHQRFRQGRHLECLCCGGEIPQARLLVEPAVTCTNCQKVIERGFTLEDLQVLRANGVDCQQVRNLLSRGQIPSTILANLLG